MEPSEMCSEMRADENGSLTGIQAFKETPGSSDIEACR
jgi:hypothetical protein